MKIMNKALMILLLFATSISAFAQTKVVYPLPLLHENNEIWGYAYNGDRKLQVIGYMFDQANQFEGATGLAIVRMDGYAGAIDINGNFIIDPVYDDISYQPYSNSYIVLKNE